MGVTVSDGVYPGSRVNVCQSSPLEKPIDRHSTEVSRSSDSAMGLAASEEGDRSGGGGRADHARSEEGRARRRAQERLRSERRRQHAAFREADAAYQRAKREAKRAQRPPGRPVCDLGRTLVELTRNPSGICITLMDPKIQKILAPTRRIRLFREPEPPAGPGPFTLAVVGS